MANLDTRLVQFIKEARIKGYNDYNIKSPLLEKGWTEEEINSAFSLANLDRNKKLKEKEEYKEGVKSKIEIYLDYEIIKNIEKRAKRNMLSLPEQIEDIIRRSCVRSKSIKPLQPEKIDDLLVSVFSRRKSGRRLK